VQELGQEPVQERVQEQELRGKHSIRPEGKKLD
jgi:hypothetical protein